MKADTRFLNQPMLFWANVRTISQAIGYTVPKTKSIRIPTLTDMRAAMESVGLTELHLIDLEGRSTDLALTLEAYFGHRANVLNETVAGLLMDVPDASSLYERLLQVYQPRRLPPMNKQKDTKKTVSFLTAIVNLLIESSLEQIASDLTCDYDPRLLTTATKNRAPLRTLARRVDGAFPSTVNPISVWEIKEYY